MIKAIETVHNGYRFRSRLEARWAVFFEYQYEPEGYKLSNGMWYLPDFWIPEWDCWVEIKPTIPKFKLPRSDDYVKCQFLAKDSEKVVLLIGGSPGATIKVFPIKMGDSFSVANLNYGIAIFCGEMLVNDYANWLSEGMVYHIPISNFGQYHSHIFEDCFVSSAKGLYGFILHQYKEHSGYFNNSLPMRGDALGIIEADRIYYAEENGGEHPAWLYDIAQTGYSFTDCKTSIRFGKVIGIHYDNGHPGRSTGLLAEAYLAARQARFEHNER